MKESTRVLVALAAAVALGALIAASHNASLLHAADAIAPIGTLWVNAIRMTVIPLVVSLLITGVASVSDIRAVGVPPQACAGRSGARPRTRGTPDVREIHRLAAAAEPDCRGGERRHAAA